MNQISQFLHEIFVVLVQTDRDYCNLRDTSEFSVINMLSLTFKDSDTWYRTLSMKNTVNFMS